MEKPRRQSWGGDVDTSFALLQEKYAVVEVGEVGGKDEGKNLEERSSSGGWVLGLFSWALSAINGVGRRRREPRVHSNDPDFDVSYTEEEKVRRGESEVM